MHKQMISFINKILFIEGQYLFLVICKKNVKSIDIFQEKSVSLMRYLLEKSVIDNIEKQEKNVSNKD